MLNWFKRRRIGLALGSGGARGLSHIGVIRVLRDAGIPIHTIAGSSIGSIVGALYAATEDIERVEHFALTTNWRELCALLDPYIGKGLLKGDKLESFFRTLFPRDDFSSLRIPFAAVATNMMSGEPHVFHSGSIARALRASASVPLMFRPLLTEDGIQYGDGGLSLPVPVSVARRLGADVVVAVDLDAHRTIRVDMVSNIFDMTQRAIDLLSVHLARENVASADIIIVPPVSDVGWGSFLTPERTREVIERGARAAHDALPNIQTAERSWWARHWS